MLDLNLRKGVSIANCLIGFSCVLLTACSSDQSYPVASGQKNPYHNGFMLVQIVTTEFYGDTPDIYTSEIVYDAERNEFLILDEIGDPNTTFSMSQTGLVFSVSESNIEFPYISSFYYDESNRLYSVFEGGNPIISISYPTIQPDSLGPLDPLLLPEIVREYDDYGDIDDLIIDYDVSASGVEMISESFSIFLTLTAVTEKMLVLEITTNESDEVLDRIEYDYDNDGNLIAIREFGLDGALSIVTTFEYVRTNANVTNLALLFFNPFPFYESL